MVSKSRKLRDQPVDEGKKNRLWRDKTRFESSLVATSVSPEAWAPEPKHTRVAQANNTVLDHDGDILDSDTKMAEFQETLRIYIHERIHCGGVGTHSFNLLVTQSRPKQWNRRT